jgi:ATP-binding cassette subfamily C (CFTR/MRP) protein 1
VNWNNPLNQAYAIEIFALLLALVQLALLVSWVLLDHGKRAAAVPSTAFNLLLSMLILPLSYFEDSRSIRPSNLLNVYFLFSLLFEVAQARSLYLLGNIIVITELFSAQLGLKVVLLILEAQNKRKYLKPEYQQLSPEATGGIISRSLFWWLNDLFWKGSQGLVKFEDLYDLDYKLGGQIAGNKMKKSWADRCENLPCNVVLDR